MRYRKKKNTFAIIYHSKPTVRSNTQNGNEKYELESLVYKTVSFSTPKIIASSNKIAKGYTFNENDNIIRFDINVCRLP